MMWACFLSVAATVTGTAARTLGHRIHQQHHLVDAPGNLTRQQDGATRVTPSTVEPVVNNSVSLKTLRNKSTSNFTKTLAAIWLWGCIKPGMKTFVTGDWKHTQLLQALETSTIRYPKTFPSIMTTISFVVFVSKRFLDLIYLQYLACFLFHCLFLFLLCMLAMRAGLQYGEMRQLKHTVVH